MKNGYFQVHLPEKSRKYTTFLTEEGRYYTKRYPQGMSSSSDIFNRFVENVLQGVDPTSYLHTVDDILLANKLDSGNKYFA